MSNERHDFGRQTKGYVASLPPVPGTKPGLDDKSRRLEALRLAVQSYGVQPSAGAGEIILRRAAEFDIFLSGASGNQPSG